MLPNRRQSGPINMQLSRTIDKGAQQGRQPLDIRIFTDTEVEVAQWPATRLKRPRPTAKIGILGNSAHRASEYFFETGRSFFYVFPLNSLRTSSLARFLVNCPHILIDSLFRHFHLISFYNFLWFSSSFFFFALYSINT